MIPVFGKRIDGVNGRRTAVREPVGLAVAILRLDRSYSAVVSDLSQVGAQLRECGDVSVGQVLWLKVGIIDALATVVWVRDGLCGVRFDEPLEPDDLEHLRHEARNLLVTWLTGEERQVAVDWLYGSR